jgi:hypothetical protein
MIKLKRILFEGLEKLDVAAGEVPLDVIFTLSEQDPWEYMLKGSDSTHWIMYTRKKGEKKWRLMKDVAADFKLAMQRITTMDKYEIVPSVKDKTNSKTNKDTKVSTDNSKTKDIKVKTNDLAADYKIQTDIVATLYDMITKNPAKYFKKFKTLINDDETAASMFFQKAQTQFEAQLANIKNKDNEDIALNTKLIKNIMNDIYKSIKNNLRIKKSIQLTDPTYKSSGDNIKNRTYSAEMYWQYFNN